MHFHFQYTQQENSKSIVKQIQKKLKTNAKQILFGYDVYSDILSQLLSLKGQAVIRVTLRERRLKWYGFRLGTHTNKTQQVKSAQEGRMPLGFFCIPTFNPDMDIYQGSICVSVKAENKLNKWYNEETKWEPGWRLVAQKTLTIAVNVYALNGLAVA